ncbi:MAG: hypothetical protein JW957_04425 [Candidatus Omnitrophica bacterium]|nr:hypothetical protein [Candidatus Omnitrophota bacterium]
MEKVIRKNELKVLTKDRVGAIAELSKMISEKGVNIEDICVYTLGGDVAFYIVTDDNKKLSGILSKKGYRFEERQVVMLSLENRPGALQEVADKLKQENIDIKYLYGTTASCKGENTTIIFSSSDDEKAIEVLKFVLSLSDWAR